LRSTALLVSAGLHASTAPGEVLAIVLFNHLF
jgi:hypothetical protein